jgi:hypothetical protein
MSLRDSLANVQHVRKGPTCSMKNIIDSLSKEDADALAEALANPNVTGRAITEALRAEGHDTRDHSVNRHRRGLCQCGDA